MKKIHRMSFAAALLVAVGFSFTSEASAQEKIQGKVQAKVQTGPLFVDADGDGICDNFGSKLGQGKGKMGSMRGKGYGPGDGTGNQGVRPQDGTGFGAGNGTGVCDGTGPKGRGGRK